jgi:hypothetical protein
MFIFIDQNATGKLRIEGIWFPIQGSKKKEFMAMKNPRAIVALRQ